MFDYPTFEEYSSSELLTILKRSCSNYDFIFNTKNIIQFAYAAIPNSMSYPIDKIVNIILSLKNLHKMSNFATAKAGRDVRVLTDNGNMCYSSSDYWTGFSIKLGRNFYQSIFNDTKDVSVVDVKDVYIRVATIIYGAYYHELFHVLYTPFKYCMTLTSNCNALLRDFIHQVSNILEDITIEGTGINRFPFAQPYLEKLATCFKQPEQLSMLEKAITEEPTAASTMLAYLLLFCREVNLSSLPSYQLWEDNKEFIEWGAYKCINTIDPHLRIRRQVAFAMELTKILNMEKPDKSQVDKPTFVDGPVGNLTPPSTGTYGKSILKPLEDLTDVSVQGPGCTNPEDTDEDIKTKEGDLKEQKASSPKADTSSDVSPVTSDLTKEGITMLANDEPVSRISHYADPLNKYMKTTQYLPEYNSIVNKNDRFIRQLVAIIHKRIAINNGGCAHYKMNGKLDMQTIYKRGNYKIFKKKNAPIPIADLVIQLLIDNSGSMHGSKARIAGEVLICFCEALNRLHIPFAVDAFTESGAAITISLKTFDELYDKVKTNMILFTKQFDCSKLDTWAGNVDEVNLRYVADNLSERKEKDKVLIVISDGATCGDKNTLKRVAENIEKSGISVLGIGIFDHNVEDIYSKHIVLKTLEDLEKLGDFLNKYLIGKIFK